MTIMWNIALPKHKVAKGDDTITLRTDRVKGHFFLVLVDRVITLFNVAVILDAANVAIDPVGAKELPTWLPLDLLNEIRNESLKSEKWTWTS